MLLSQVFFLGVPFPIVQYHQGLFTPIRVPIRIIMVGIGILVVIGINREQSQIILLFS